MIDPAIFTNVKWASPPKPKLIGATSSARTGHAESTAPPMEDPILSRNLADTRELATRWAQFHEFFNMATKSDKISPEAERKFMDLKTRIAMLHDALMQSIKQDQKVGQNVIGVMRQCLMLRTIPMMSQTEIQKLEFDWNEVYLLMTETIADIEEEVARLAGVSKRAHQIQQIQKRLRAQRQKFFADTRVRVAIWVGGTLAVLGFLLFGIPAMGIYDYQNVKQDVPWLTTPYNSAAGIVRLFDPEYAFIDEAEMKTPFVEWGATNALDKGLKSQMSDKNFLNQLTNYGFAASDVDEVRGFLEVKRYFYKEILRDTANNKMFIYAYLFDTTEHATRFVELRKANLEAMTDGERQKKIEDRMAVARNANFVVLIESKNRFGMTNYLVNRWKFKPEQIDGYLAPAT